MISLHELLCRCPIHEFEIFFRCFKELQQLLWIIIHDSIHPTSTCRNALSLPCSTQSCRILVAYLDANGAILATTFLPMPFHLPSHSPLEHRTGFSPLHAVGLCNCEIWQNLLCVGSAMSAHTLTIARSHDKANWSKRANSEPNNQTRLRQNEYLCEHESIEGIVQVRWGTTYTPEIGL